MVHETLVVEEIKLSRTFDDICVVAVKIFLQSFPFKLVNVYSRPQCNDNQFSEISIFMQEIFCDDLATLVTGDWNMPDIDWVSNTSPSLHHQADIVGMFSDFGLEQLVLEPTHDKGNILDLVLCNEPNLAYDINVLDHFTTSCDHRMVSFRIHGGSNENLDKQKSRNFRKTNFSELRAFLSNVNWPELLDNFDAFSTHKFAEIFYTVLETGVELFVPLDNRNPQSTGVRKLLL